MRHTMAVVLDGKQLATQLLTTVAARVQALAARQITPKLAVLLVGDHPASEVYVRGKTKACTELGIRNVEVHLPATADAPTLLEQIDRLNADATVHAILVQLPLPPHINATRVLERVAPHKDVDGFHPANMGRLALGLPGVRPCTPLGIMTLIEATGVPIDGARAAVLGRSAIVGRPTAFLLMEANATVTLCHSHTRDLATICRASDILVAAMGKPRFVQGDWIRPGATVIDVGITRCADGQLVGDVDFVAAAARAGHITPVPGGVGPLTIAMLLKNTVDLAESFP